MPQSIHLLHTHIVFSTKNRITIIGEPIEEKLHNYMAGILREMGCKDILINGSRDHVHIYCLLTKMHSTAKVLESLKRDSSKWVKLHFEEMDGFYWQDGYGCFSLSPSHVEGVKRYIRNQKQHHRKVSFRDEYRHLLQRYGYDAEDPYLWD